METKAAASARRDRVRHHRRGPAGDDVRTGVQHGARRRTADRCGAYLSRTTRESAGHRRQQRPAAQTEGRKPHRRAACVTRRPLPGSGERSRMSQQQWYMAIGGHQVGPVSQDDVITNLRNGTIDGNTLVFTEGLKNWTPLKDVAQLSSYLAGPGGDRAATTPPPPVVPGLRAHDIDFRIVGSEMQFVEVELDPGESAGAEAGSMMYMTPAITMETVCGDGGQPSGGGVMNAILGAGKRLLTGESLFMTVFTNQGSGKQQVSFSPPFPGKILAMDLKQLGGTLICQKDSFLCAARGISIGIAFQRR